ncbi:MAG: hypothetical protein ACRDLO_01355 [Solirubrobacterales bacterium]
MPDPSAADAPSVADAELAVARLAAMSADLRGCAILAADGEPLAASGELEPWGEAAGGLLAAADAAAGEPVSHAHVGTEDGEVFAVRLQGFALVAASERFALASLMLFDMRAVLRDLVRGPGIAPIHEVEAEAA